MTVLKFSPCPERASTDDTPTTAAAKIEIKGGRGTGREEYD